MEFLKEYQTEIVSLVLDAAVGAILYKLYKDSSRSAIAVKNAECIVIDDTLRKQLEASDECRIPYVCVDGIVTCMGAPLRSQYKDLYKGVLRRTTVTEHKSKRINGVWTDAKHVIKDVMDQLAFFLTKPETDTKICVEDADGANFIYDDLLVTFDSYTPNKSSFLEKGLDRIFGEVSKGVHEMEQMLCEDTKILGLGELVLEDNTIKLVSPTTDSALKFILTTGSKKEVIKSLMSTAFWYKFWTSCFGVVGFGIVIYIAVKYYRLRRAKQQQELLIEEIRAARSAQANAESDVDNQTENMCVICLVNPRDIVLLNCGHVCICSECVAILPRPKLCPMCRRSVSRHVPIYVS